MYPLRSRTKSTDLPYNVNTSLPLRQNKAAKTRTLFTPSTPAQAQADPTLQAANLNSIDTDPTAQAIHLNSTDNKNNISYSWHNYKEASVNASLSRTPPQVSQILQAANQSFYPNLNSPTLRNNPLYPVLNLPIVSAAPTPSNISTKQADSSTIRTNLAPIFANESNNNINNPSSYNTPNNYNDITIPYFVDQRTVINNSVGVNHHPANYSIDSEGDPLSYSALRLTQISTLRNELNHIRNSALQHTNMTEGLLRYR